MIIFPKGARAGRELEESIRRSHLHPLCTESVCCPLSVECNIWRFEEETAASCFGVFFADSCVFHSPSLSQACQRATVARTAPSFRNTLSIPGFHCSSSSLERNTCFYIPTYIFKNRSKVRKSISRFYQHENKKSRQMLHLSRTVLVPGRIESVSAILKRCSMDDEGMFFFSCASFQLCKQFNLSHN